MVWKYPMDKSIAELEQLTNDLIVHLNMKSYEELEGFVAKRQELIDEITNAFNDSPVTPSQQERIHKILAHDLMITNRMSELMNEASKWLTDRSKAKAQRNIYEATYTPDAFLMDKRN